MLDIKLIRERPDFVKAELAKRGVDPIEVDRLLEADQKRRQSQHNLDDLLAERKRQSREIGKLAPEERALAIQRIREAEEDEKKQTELLMAAALRGERVGVSNIFAALRIDLRLAEKKVEELALTLPNIPRPYVVVGASEADNRVIKTEGTPTEFTSFKPLPHWELGENLRIIDFDRRVKLSGTRFYVLSGAGARLQRALITWMLDVKTREQGYLEIKACA